MSEKIRKVAADFNTSLSTKLEVAGTTFTLSSATDDDGVVLADGDYCFTVNNESSNKEYFVGTLDGSTKIVTAVKTITRQGAETSGAAREHRAGSPVIISDFAALRDVVETLRGAKSLDADNPLVYDAEPTLSNREDLATKAYVDDTTNGGEVSYAKLIATGNAGATVAAGDVLYFDTSDQEWKLADADTAYSDDTQFGIAQGAGTDGASITGGVLVRGTDTNQTGLTAGATQYISTTGTTTNTLTETAPTNIFVVGVAKNTTTVIVNFDTSQLSRIQTGMIMPYVSDTPPSGWLNCDGSAVSRTTYATLYALIADAYGDGDGSTTFNLPDLKSSVPVGSGQKTKAFTFVDGDVNTGTDVITIDSNDFIQTGTALVLSTDGVLPTGLSATTYYAIKVTATTIKLATSIANANAGTEVNITAAAGGGTHTLTLTLTDRSLGDTGGEETHALTDDEMPSHTHDITTFNDETSSGGVGEGGGTNQLRSDVALVRGSDTVHNNMPPYVVVNYIIKF